MWSIPCNATSSTGNWRGELNRKEPRTIDAKMSLVGYGGLHWKVFLRVLLGIEDSSSDRKCPGWLLLCWKLLALVLETGGFDGRR